MSRSLFGFGQKTRRIRIDEARSNWLTPKVELMGELHTKRKEREGHVDIYHSFLIACLQKTTSEAHTDAHELLKEELEFSYGDIQRQESEAESEEQKSHADDAVINEVEGNGNGGGDNGGGPGGSGADET